MGIGYALYEEKIMDQNLGCMLNPNMEFYRLCGIGDTGDLVVHLMSGKGYDERGIVGCGEAACHLTGSGNLQRSRQCDWCPCSAPSADARPRVGSVWGAVMNPFTYSSPTDLPSALDCWEEHGERQKSWPGEPTCLPY